MKDRTASGTKPGPQHAHNAASVTPAPGPPGPGAPLSEEVERQTFIDAAAIAFHRPGVLAAKAFRLADELWAERALYLKRRLEK